MNDVRVNVDIQVFDQETNHIQVEFMVRGENEFHLFSNLLRENTFDIKVPEFDMDYKAKILSSSSSYNDQLTGDTPVRFSVELQEYDEENDSNWNATTATGVIGVQNWARTRALAELLQEKGILTKQEYDEKIRQVLDRDKEEMISFFTGEDRDFPQE
ncbi:DUF3219 family protein [Thalassobacillus devorans]|nr:DUF3219 family protein [Thalassobacillus devorans]